MCHRIVLRLLVITLTCTIEAQVQSQSPDGTGQADVTRSQEELTQELSNPVGDLWLIVNEFNTSDIKNVPGDEHIYNWNLQPVLPVHLNKNWNLINRPYVPFLYDSPTLSEKPLLFPIQLIDDSGIGDVGVVSLLSPRKPPPLGRGKLIWALGPTFLFPTASKSTFGYGKWQAGPVGALAYLDKKWVLGVFLQQWWSFAGDANRKDTNFAWVQYFAAYQFAPGWQVTAGSPIITVDWRRHDVSFPIGAGMSYTSFLGKLPVEFGFEFQKTVVHPDAAPYQGNLFRMNIVPVLPVLFGSKGGH